MSESSKGKSDNKRSWPWKIAELLFWAIVAVATAVTLVALSETLLPTNF